MPCPLARCTCLPYLHINQVKSNWLTNNLRISIRILYKYSSPPLSRHPCFPYLRSSVFAPWLKAKARTKRRQRHQFNCRLFTLRSSSFAFFRFLFLSIFSLMQIAVEKHYLVFICLVLIVEIETSLNNLVARVRIFPQKKKHKNRWSFRHTIWCINR